MKPRPIWLRGLFWVAFVMLALEPVRWGWDSLMASEVHLSLHDAGRRDFLEGGLGQELWSVAGAARVAIFAHPPSRLEWPLIVRRGEHRIRVEVALAEEARSSSDGVSFRVVVVQEGRESTVGSRRLEPRDRPEDRGWIPLEAEFESAGGEILVALETAAGESADFDWGLWGEPRIDEGVRPLSWPWLLAWSLIAGFLSRRSGRAFPWRWLAWPVMVVATLGMVEVLYRVSPEAFPSAAYPYLARNGLDEIGDRTPLRRADPELGYQEPAGRCDSYRRRFDAFLEQDLSAAFEIEERRRIRFCTDDEGFRNPTGIEQAQVVVTGDSFVQGAWLDREQIFTSILAERLDRSVVNLGVSGYAPRQSLLALQRYGLPRSPDLVLFTLFAGNDLADGEQFDAFLRSGLSWTRFLAAGEQARDDSVVVRRHQHSFALAGLAYLAGRVVDTLARWPAELATDVAAGFNPVCASWADGPKRCFAFTAQELRRETISADGWRRRPGHELLREVLVELRESVAAEGARVKVLVVPTRASIYLPLLGAALPELALGDFLEEEGEPPPEAGSRLERLERNSGAAHTAMTELVAEVGLEAIDLRPAFEAAAARGELLYFPYDSHWNEAGHRLAAGVLAEELAR